MDPPHQRQEGDRAHMKLDDDEPQPVTPLDHACHRLLKAMVRTAYYDPSPSEFAAYPQEDPRGYLEGVLHEISHVVVFRHGVRAALRQPFKYRIGAVVPSFPEHNGKRSKADLRKTDIANAHEIDTIAVEVIASRVVGMPIEALVVAEYAVGGGNVQDLGSDENVAALVERAMKRPEIRRWGRDLGKHLRAMTLDTGAAIAIV